MWRWGFEVVDNINKKWKIKPLSQFCELITDGTHLTPPLVESGIPMLDVKDLDESFNINFDNAKKFITKKTDDELGKKCKPREDDILISSRGTIGRIGIIKKNQDFNIMGNMILVRVNKNILNVKFTAYGLKLLKYEFDKLSRGVAQKGLYLNNVRKFNYFCPELEEQQLIVDEIEKQFTRLDASVKDLKSVKEKLEIYRKSVLEKSFYGDSKNLPQIITPNKQSIKRGPFGGSLKKEIFVPKGYKVYEQQHAINNDFSIGRYFITSEKFEEMNSFSVKPGDFIISCSGTIGKIAEVPIDAERGIINQALLKITLDNSKILNKYFKYLFESELIQRHLTKISRGVAIKNVPSVKELKEINFPVPSMKEQTQIVQEIESHFSVINRLEQTVDSALIKTELLRKSILKSAFEGKLVTVND